MLQCDEAAGLFHAAQRSDRPTCCRRGRGGETQSPGCCPAWCCDRGSGPSAAPPLASAGSAAAEGAASRREAGRLQGHTDRGRRGRRRGRGGRDKFEFCRTRLAPAPGIHVPGLQSLRGGCVNTWAHFVVCPAVCCGRRCPCPPTLPWPSDPQHGCTSSTCGRRECRS